MQKAANPSQVVASAFPEGLLFVEIKTDKAKIIEKIIKD